MAGEGQYGERYENPHIGPWADMGFLILALSTHISPHIGPLQPYQPSILFFLHQLPRLLTLKSGIKKRDFKNLLTLKFFAQKQ